MGTKITFLGTGGGRHTTMYQARCTGGMLIEHGSDRRHVLHVDPGPGALTQMHRIHYDLSRTDSTLISHAHIDHYSDAASVIEGMTRGGWTNRGHLYGSVSVMQGSDGLGPCLSDYHMRIVKDRTVFRPGDTLDIDGMRTDVCRAKHSDPTNVGFRFMTPDGIISYVSDTEFTEDIAEQYIGTRVLILPVTTPNGMRIPFHLCTEDAIKFIDIVKPELTVFIHLGVVMIKKGPHLQAEKAEERTGIRTMAGTDLMVMDIADTIDVSRAKTYSGEWIPPSSP